MTLDEVEQHIAALPAAEREAWLAHIAQRFGMIHQPYPSPLPEGYKFEVTHNGRLECIPQRPYASRWWETAIW
jgi:hypothetical protein